MTRNVLTAAAIAALAVASCSSQSGGPSAPSTARTATSAAAASCQAQMTQWADGPGYGALKRLNHLVWNPIDISAAKLSSALAAVQAHPLPRCARAHDWAELITDVHRAIVNARAGNTSTAAGAEGGAAADIMSLSFDAEGAGYNGPFPSN
jgi:hypothetical protein